MDNSFIKIHKWLYPVSALYGTGVWLRNKLFDWGIYEEKKFDLPIISVGNITVGGTGKTPHTEYLIKLLQNNYKVAVLSRGYKRKSKGFVLASEDTDVSQIGDEPYQMKHKFPSIHMAVDKNRCHGIEMLCITRRSADTEVILLDDAFQHRYVKPGLNILLVDHNRMLCDDALLPAGRMRESEKGKGRANIVIITKCPSQLSPFNVNLLRKKMDLFPFQELYFTTLSYGKLYNIDHDGKEYSLSTIKKDINILLVTGIASPEKLIADLSEHNSNINSLSFSDHHDFSKEDLKLIKDKFEQLPEKKRMIITTEKDAVRLSSHPDLNDSLRPYIYILPVEISFLFDQQDNFNLNITDYVRKNSRNSILSAREDAY